MAKIILKDIDKKDIITGDYIVLEDELELVQIVYIHGIGYGVLCVEDGRIYNHGADSIEELLKKYKCNIYRIIKSEDIEIREL